MLLQIPYIKVATALENVSDFLHHCWTLSKDWGTWNLKKKRTLLGAPGLTTRSKASLRSERSDAPHRKRPSKHSVSDGSQNIAPRLNECVLRKMLSACCGSPGGTPLLWRARFTKAKAKALDWDLFNKNRSNTRIHKHGNWPWDQEDTTSLRSSEQVMMSA